MFARAIFNIGTILKHLKAQTDLLSLIAQKNGIDIKQVKAIREGNSLYELRQDQKTT